MKTKVKFLLFTLGLVGLLFFQQPAVLAQTWYVNPPDGSDDQGSNTSGDGSQSSPWLSVQFAVDHANVLSGHNIIVMDGTSQENVTVTKQLTIRSQNGYDFTKIEASNTDLPVFRIQADYVTIQGFELTGSTILSGGAGVMLEINTDHCVVQNNYCHDNWFGVYISYSSDHTIRNNICNTNLEIGVNNYNSNNNLFRDNHCSGNYIGFKFFESENITLLDNNSSSNTGHGIELNEVLNSTLRGNLVQNNTQIGIYLYHCTNADLGANDVSDKGRNTIMNNGGDEINNSSTPDVNAYYNYWGVNDENTIKGHIYDYDEDNTLGRVYFDPWLISDESLPVELSTFTAIGGNEQVRLKWTTESEVENAGFNVYRSFTEKGSYLKITGTLIPGAGSTSERQQYQFTDYNVVNGTTYFYKLEDVDIKGIKTFHGPVSATPITSSERVVPKEFCLHANYPNPFNPSTTIVFDLPEEDFVQLTVYDLLGNRVITLVDEQKKAGAYQSTWDGKNHHGQKLSSGVYFYRLVSGRHIEVKKMTLMQ